MKLFYDPAYTNAGHSFDTTRKARWVAERLFEYPLPHVDITSPAPLEESLLHTTHSDSYINAVKSGQPRPLAESQGFTWNDTLYASVCASNSGAVEAAVQALKDGVSGSLSSGLHHAYYHQGRGFCTFNGLVMAAHAAIRQGARKVLILDLDAHCGGGTNSLIQGSPEISHLDISVNPFDHYVASRKSDSLTLLTEGAEYLASIGLALKKQAQERQCFDLCIYNAGVDPFEDCRIGGLQGITQSDLARRDELVFQWFREREVPVAFVLAGGYIGDNLNRAKLVDLHVQTIAAAQELSS